MRPPDHDTEHEQSDDLPAEFLATRQIDLPMAEREALIIEHLPLVRMIARQMHRRFPPQVSLEDLCSAGVIGLLSAFRRFDPARQIKFRTFAQIRIRGAILDSLRTLDWSSRGLRRMERAVEQAIQTLTAQHGRSANDSEIAHELNIDLAAYQQLLHTLDGLKLRNLHSARSDPDDEEDLIYLPSRLEDDPLYCFLDSEVRQWVTNGINNLPDRERLVITLYYYEELTMREIATVLGIKESRVSKLHSSAVLHLRARLGRRKR